MIGPNKFHVSGVLFFIFEWGLVASKTRTMIFRVASSPPTRRFKIFLL